MSQSSKNFEPFEYEAEDDLCPLCVEEMDLSDKNFIPCPCGYRVCMWCWHHIKENLNGLCPACRTPYEDDPHAFAAVDRDQVVKKKKEKKQKKVEKKGDKVPIDKRSLHNVRVIQRNLVYVIGLPLSIASEEDLRRGEYFGQYGKILKVVVNHNHGAPPKDPRHGSASAYITFSYKEDAKAAIQSIDGFLWDGRLIRASFGTTKYCNNFLRNLPCTNPECLYLHELGESEDRFTKEEIQTGASKSESTQYSTQTVVGEGGPSGTGKRVANSVFPPPVFEAPKRSSQASSVSGAMGKAQSAQGPVWGNTPVTNGQMHTSISLNLQSNVSVSSPITPNPSFASAPTKSGGNDGGQDADRPKRSVRKNSSSEAEKSGSDTTARSKLPRRPLAAPPGVAAGNAPPGVPIPSGIAFSNAPPGVPPPTNTVPNAKSSSPPPGVVLAVPSKADEDRPREKLSRKEAFKDRSKEEPEKPKKNQQESKSISKQKKEAKETDAKPSSDAIEHAKKAPKRKEVNISVPSVPSPEKNKRKESEVAPTKESPVRVQKSKDDKFSKPQPASGGTGFGSMLIGSTYSDIWSAGTDHSDSNAQSKTSNFAGVFGGSAVFPGMGNSFSKSIDMSKQAEADLSVNPFQKTDALAKLLGITLPPVDAEFSLAKKSQALKTQLSIDDVVHRPQEQPPHSESQQTHSQPPHNNLLNSSSTYADTHQYQAPVSSTANDFSTTAQESIFLASQDQANKAMLSQPTSNFQQFFQQSSHHPSIQPLPHFSSKQSHPPQNQEGLQSGMALLQKMLPNVNVSYGENSTIQQPNLQNQPHLPPFAFQESNNISLPPQQQPQPQQHQQQHQHQHQQQEVPLAVGWSKPQVGNIDAAQAFGASMWTMAPESSNSLPVSASSGWGGQPKNSSSFHQSYESELGLHSQGQNFTAYKAPESQVHNHAHSLYPSFTASRMTGF